MSDENNKTMAEMKHTPGPWEYYPANNYCGFAIAPLGTLPTLAAVERPRNNPHTLSVTAFNFPGETEANARLIAAAPDLFEALRALATECSQVWSADEFPALKAAFAALSKATTQQEGR